MNWFFSSIGISATLASLLAPPAFSAEQKYICVWRNPERTMRRLFPEARDYKTMTADISKAQLAKIEELAGVKLLPGQREVFQYYDMLGKRGKKIGTLIAASQKGTYGAIEFVFGLNLSRTITGIYVQRARERDRAFKKKEFLTQFVGKGPADLASLDELAGGEKSVGKAAIVYGIKKEIAALEVLVK